MRITPKLCTMVILITGSCISNLAAQSLTQTIQGRWTTRSVSECQSHFYIWKVMGDEVEFSDERSQVDIEDIVENKGVEFSTRTRVSRHPFGKAEAPGTRWNYAMLTDGRVRVQNLLTGRTFYLTRCPDFPPVVAQPATTPRPSSTATTPEATQSGQTPIVQPRTRRRNDTLN
jgi:hypothetical protein